MLKIPFDPKTKKITGEAEAFGSDKKYLPDTKFKLHTPSTLDSAKP
jgi:hypothetical protein